jgi:2-iminobutanoate/2-iminopropanoate deaminase
MTQRSWTSIGLPAEFPAPAGAYSPAVRAGNLVFVSGQVPKDPRTGEVRGADVREQTRAVLENVERALGAAGATLDDVVSVTAYLASIDDWTAFNEVYRAVFTIPYPARTTVGAHLHGFLVEISVIAYVHGAR